MCNTNSDVGVTSGLTCMLCLEVFSISENLDIHLKEHIREPHRDDTIADTSMEIKREVNKETDIKVNPFTKSDSADCEPVEECYVHKQTAKASNTQRKPKAKQSSKYTKEKHTCTVCSLSFWSKPRLEEHKEECLAKNAVERNTCKICNKVFVSLRDHMITHSEKYAYKCDICSKAFKRSSSLFRHKVTHTGTGFPCDVCGQVFKSYSSRSIHKWLHRPYPPEKRFKCSVCMKAFLIKRDLDNHMTSHTHQRNYQCDQCGKSYPSRGSLKRHLRIHTGEPIATCPICGRKFTQHKGQLTNHMRVHTGERPFVCEICGMAFKLAKTLRVHKKGRHKHTNDQAQK